MLTLENQIIFHKNQCQQCGICVSVCPVSAISLKLESNGLSDLKINQNLCIKCAKCIKVCPANKTVDLNQYFDSFPNKQYYLGYNNNDKIRKLSSSGGVAKSLIIESLKKDFIDGVYCLAKSSTYPYAEGRFFSKNDIPTYEDISNSVYHSVMLNKNIDFIEKCNNLMVVGTSCQIRGLEYFLKGKYKNLIKVCIFCKQQKTLDSTKFLAKILSEKIEIKKPFQFNYRGNGWPGLVQINNSNLLWDIAARIPFGRRLWTVPGCNICGDPFGVNVDITLMDPWLIEKTNKLGKTLAIVHTKSGNDLLNKVGQLTLEPKVFKDIKPALDFSDIKKKQILVPYFRNEKCSLKIRIIGLLESFQRRYLTLIVEKMPKMPLIFYKAINKTPDLRNIFLRNVNKKNF